MSGAYTDSKLMTAPDQSIDDRSRAVTHREEFAGLLTLELYTHRFEPADDRVLVKCSKYVANRIARAIEVVGMDFTIGDIAAAAARDEDFCADAPRRFQYRLSASHAGPMTRYARLHKRRSPLRVPPHQRPRWLCRTYPPRLPRRILEKTG